MTRKENERRRRRTPGFIDKDCLVFRDTLPCQVDIQGWQIHDQLSESEDTADQDQRQLLTRVGRAAPAPGAGHASPDHQSAGAGDDDGQGKQEPDDGHGGQVCGGALSELGLAESGAGES